MTKISSAQLQSPLNSSSLCIVLPARYDHGPWDNPAHSLYKDRFPDQSFLWSVIRDPTKRAVSQFFHFEVSRRKEEPTDSRFKRFLLEDKKEFLTDYYYQTLSTKSRFDRRKNDPIETANDILAEYDFIGITERMEESAVALMMLLDLKMSDILFLSAKGKGGYDDGGGESPGCTYIWPSFLSPGMEEFFDTNDEWKEMIQYDVAIYKAANASLDLTIDALGRDLFAENLARFKHAREEAQRQCLPTVVFPCDSGGTLHKNTDCLWNDSGCGTTCLDRVAEDLGLS